MRPGKFEIQFSKEKFPAFYVTNKKVAIDAVKKLSQYDCIFGIDTETEALPEFRADGLAGLSPHLSKVRLLQVFNQKSSVVFDLKYIQDTSIFVDFLNAKEFVAHYATFDLQRFMQWGALNMNIHCSNILSRILMHARYTEDHSTKLKDMVSSLFGEAIGKEAQTSNWSTPELTAEQVKYSALDPVCCYKVFAALHPIMKKYKMEKYYNLLKAAQHPIASMQLNGISIRTEYYRELITKWLKELKGARNEVEGITKLDKITDSTLADWLGKNLEPDVLEFWPRTDHGKLKTDAHTFADYSHLPVIRPFSEFQKRKKLTSSFGTKLVNMRNRNSGRIHGSFNLTGARTGRLSASSPNLQQLPRDKDVRSAFVPREGYTFLCADYSQIELRVMAELSRDPELLKAYETGEDVHMKTACFVSRVKKAELAKLPKERIKEMRQQGKSLNFGLAFGIGGTKYAHYAKKNYGVEISVAQGKKEIEDWRRLYNGYYKWQMDQATRGAIKLYTTTPVGKFRKLDSENTYGTSMNTPVQGGAAECMFHAICKIYKQIVKHNLKSRFCNIVHDELLIESPPEEVPLMKAIIKKGMELGFLEVFPNGCIKDITEVGVGVTWGDAKP